MKPFFLTLALCALTAAPTQMRAQELPAQPRWSLDECIRYAQQNNIEVKQRALSVLSLIHI